MDACRGLSLLTKIVPLPSPRALRQAWGKAKTRESLLRCRRLLKRMVAQAMLPPPPPRQQQQYSTKQKSVRPSRNDSSNNKSKSKGTKSSTPASYDDDDDYDVATMPFPPPDTTSYNLVMECLLQSRQLRDPAPECQRLVQQMVDLTTRRYPNNTNNNDAKRNNKKNNSNNDRKSTEAAVMPVVVVAPNLESYTLLVKSWLRSPQPGAAQRAQDVVQQMEDRLRRGTSDLVPDAHLYNTVLTKWSRTTAAASQQQQQHHREYQEHYHQTSAKCLTLLQDMEELFRKSIRSNNEDADGNKRTTKQQQPHQQRCRRIPNTVSYNIVLHTLAKTQHLQQRLPDQDDVVPTQVMDILRRMKDLYQNHGRLDCRPDVITYTSCIDVVAKNGNGEEAEALLLELEKAYRESGGQEALQPNIRTYTSVRDVIPKFWHLRLALTARSLILAYTC